MPRRKRVTSPGQAASGFAWALTSGRGPWESGGKHPCCFFLLGESAPTTWVSYAPSQNGRGDIPSDMKQRLNMVFGAPLGLGQVEFLLMCVHVWHPLKGVTKATLTKCLQDERKWRLLGCGCQNQWYQLGVGAPPILEPI